jgi:hypothetical protein
MASAYATVKEKDMTEFYEEDVSEEEHILSIQRRINDGSIWLFEGSAGREAMALLEAGYCMLPKHATRDYWGNYLPARDELKPGTKGTWQNVERRMGRSWAQRMSGA